MCENIRVEISKHKGYAACFGLGLDDSIQKISEYLDETEENVELTRAARK